MKNKTSIEKNNNIIVVQNDEVVFFENFLISYNITWPIEQKQEGIIILSKSMVGVINTPVRKIRLLPKFKELTLDHVLRLYFFVNGYKSSSDDGLLNVTNNNNFNTIIKQFIKNTEHAVLRGLPKEYIQTEKRTNFWKGKVNAVKSIKNVTLHQQKPVATKVSILSVDSVLNQLLKAALQKVTHHADLGLHAKRLLTYFEDISTSNDSGDIQYRNIIFTTKNLEFKKLAFQAVMIIDELYIDMSSGDVGGDSFLINFDILFEKFIRKILLSLPDKKFSTWKDSKPLGEISEINSSGSVIGERIFIPDIVYKENEKNENNGFNTVASGVIDVKNKAYSQFKPADIYQISLYASILMAKHAILVYPSFQEQQNEVLFVDYKFVYMKYIYAVFINIAAPSSNEFKKSISKFTTKILTLLENT